LARRPKRRNHREKKYVLKPYIEGKGLGSMPVKTLGALERPSFPLTPILSRGRGSFRRRHHDSLDPARERR
jgi:hypothetical protein